MKGSDREFFKPLWRRIAVTAICVGWFIWELTGGDAMWIMLTGGITAYAIWVFFISFKTDEPSE